MYSENVDPYERQFQRRSIKPDAIIAFVVAVVVAYVIQFSLGFGGGRFFTVLIVALMGGLWYRIRNVV